MFDTLLIANRGEIACRIAASAQRLGIRTIAVYSDADANARHVAACDQAIHIGGAEPRASYLRADAILQAARDSGAKAIHPGYGFLSENADFAQAVIDAGLIFVGPPAAAIAAMGSKSAAKALMEKTAVPLVPGYHGTHQEPAFLKAQADHIGYPVLIKASAGGGGKGMRIVENATTFQEELAACQREAASSFGDERVIIERYLQQPRHIEVQIFADTQGHCVYLFERDCSVQRRHQKVIEEAPAPGMTDARRRAMGEAAVAAARAVGYVGAGTVEFIVEPEGRFYFMEMNTRLQVEHPVTEMITGHDLVEWQLRIAAGQALPLQQDALHIHGHAIEARVYAEDPDKGFLPSIGTVKYLAFPEHVAFKNGDVRVDGGIRTGDTITPFYDPMIAKLIVWGADRDQARARMYQALTRTHIVGVQTNVAFLARLMQDRAFATAALDTALIERQRDTLLAPPQTADATVLALASAAVLITEGLTHPLASVQNDSDPWDARDGWRLSGHYQRVLTWTTHQDFNQTVTLARHGQTWTLDTGQGPGLFVWRAVSTSVEAITLRVILNGNETAGTVVLTNHHAHVFTQTGSHHLSRENAFAAAATPHEEPPGNLTAPMPGKIISIAVQVGDQVKKGHVLLVMEAMKMEHTILAPIDGKISELFYAVGDQITDGAVLVAIT